MIHTCTTFRDAELDSRTTRPLYISRSYSPRVAARLHNKGCKYMRAKVHALVSSTNKQHSGEVSGCGRKGQLCNNNATSGDVAH